MNNLEYIILKNKLKDLRKKIKDLNIYTERGISEDREESFAFVIYTLQRYLNNYSILEVIESVTEGSGDNNIDILDMMTLRKMLLIFLFSNANIRLKIIWKKLLVIMIYVYF